MQPSEDESKPSQSRPSESAAGDKEEPPMQVQVQQQQLLPQQLPQHLLVGRQDQLHWGASDAYNQLAANQLAANALQSQLGSSISLPAFQQSQASLQAGRAQSFPDIASAVHQPAAQSAAGNAVAEAELSALLEPTPLREEGSAGNPNPPPSGASASVIRAVLSQQQNLVSTQPLLLQQRAPLLQSALMGGAAPGQIDSSTPTTGVLAQRAASQALPGLAMLQDYTAGLGTALPPQVPGNEARPQDVSEQATTLNFQDNPDSGSLDTKLPGMALPMKSGVAQINTNMDTKVPSQFDTSRHGAETRTSLPGQPNAAPALGQGSGLMPQAIGSPQSPFQDHPFLSAAVPQAQLSDQGMDLVVPPVAQAQQGIGSPGDGKADNESKEYGDSSTTTFQGKKKRMYRHESFPEKLFRLLVDLERLDRTDVASFKSNGIGFEIKQTSVFENEVLSKYFRHGKLSSFQRQLGLYGFTRSKEKGKDGEVIISYVHPMFQRSKPQVCKQMQRIDY